MLMDFRALDLARLYIPMHAGSVRLLEGSIGDIKGQDKLHHESHMLNCNQLLLTNFHRYCKKHEMHMVSICKDCAITYLFSNGNFNNSIVHKLLNLCPLSSYGSVAGIVIEEKKYRLFLPLIRHNIADKIPNLRHQNLTSSCRT
jgi:hypothetical protein